MSDQQPMIATRPTAQDAPVLDALGVTVLVGDTCRVTCYGGSVRQYDTGSLLLVEGFSAKGYVQHRTEVAGGRAVDPTYLAVRRRDGAKGHEGNRSRAL